MEGCSASTVISTIDSEEGSWFKSRLRTFQCGTCMYLPQSEILCSRSCTCSVCAGAWWLTHSRVRAARPSICDNRLITENSIFHTLWKITRKQQRDQISRATQTFSSLNMFYCYSFSGWIPEKEERFPINSLKLFFSLICFVPTKLKRERKISVNTHITHGNLDTLTLSNYGKFRYFPV